MTDYLRWSFRQLYLLCFWPTQFRREVEGDTPDRLKLRLSKSVLYLLKMLPWIVAFAVLENLIAGYICEAFGMPFRWGDSWKEVAFGVAFGAVFGVVGGAVFGVAFGAALIVAGGVAFGVTFGVMPGVGLHVGVGRTGSVALGVALGVVSGDVSAVTRLSVTFGIAGGMAIGVGLVVVGDMTFGIAVGVSFWLAYFRLVTYPLDLTLSAVTYFAGRWRSRAVARAWRWCPVAWNEMIWLPLPFAGKLLALLAKQDREEGFKQIAFVAAERRLQRRVAVVALAEVAAADLKAASLSQLADVTERLSWTTDAPMGLPDELATTLPRLDRVAQHVGQYLTLHSVYRKGEALGRAVKEVEALQQSLISARGRFAPRLLQVVNGWRGLLDAERDKVKALAEASREIPNPFVFGNPVTDTENNVFTGRRDIAEQVEASVLGAAQPPTLLLHGPRRMGKTSILFQLPRLLGPDFAPAIVDCQNPAVTESRNTLLRYLSRACSEGLRRRRVVVAPLSASELEREPFAAFDEWLDGVERVMPEGMRALLCLDEYERLQATLDAGWGGAILDALRHTFQHRSRVVLMFTGAHTFQELGPAWTDRFVSARRVRVSFLTRADVELLLTQPIPEFDMTYAAGALDALVAATSCHPFLTQAVAFELVQLMNEGGRREATAVDVEEAVGRALVSGDAYFVNVWGDAGPEGQAILSALVAGRTPPESPEARAWLREHDVLSAGGGFAVEMMRRWVAAKAAAV